MKQDECLLTYLERCLDEESNTLKKISEDTKKNVPRANMISGHYQGRLLALLSKLLNPQNILEIGTYTGYSAVSLAEGLKKFGKIYTIEKDLEIYEIAKKNIADANLDGVIVPLHGDAKEIINGLDILFDLIFIDANKNSYIEYYNKSIDILRSGGCLLVDNVLWKGEVAMLCNPESVSKTSNIGKKMFQFNEYVTKDSRVEKIILPIRDGIFLIRKI